MYESHLRSMVGRNEQILWSGKPNKKCFILESIFNPMLIFALIWAAFDSAFIGATVFGGDSEMLMFVLVFMLFHLMPVWIYLGGVLTSVIKYKNTEYIITDRAIYISGGVFTYTTEMKPLAELSHVNVHRGIWDQIIGVGDVITVCAHNTMTSQYSSSGNSSQAHSHGMNICDIADYEYVFKLIRDMQTDVYSDTMYPNAFRPEANPGYRTRYTGGYAENTDRNSSVYDDDRF